MQKILLCTALGLISALAAPCSPAQDVAPDVLLKVATSQVIDVIRKDTDIQAGNPAKVADLVETKILPLFDFTRMTEIAVARNWRLATPEQQSALTSEFKTLLVRTYSTALSSFRDQTIEFRPLRVAPHDTEVTVKSLLKQTRKQPLTMDYRMEKLTGTWKVSDITIDGMSLITAYRDTFAREVREGGIDGFDHFALEQEPAGRIQDGKKGTVTATTTKTAMTAADDAQVVADNLVIEVDTAG